MSNKKKKKNSNYQTGKVKPTVKKKKKLSKDAIVGIVCLAVILIATSIAITFCALGNRSKFVKISVEGHGDIILELDPKTAPITVDNFLTLVNDGFYDGLTFHRILENFMIQGGDPKANGSGGNTDKNGKEINIKGEFSANGVENNLAHKRGVISMARSNDYDSASSQFFICNADYPSLDGNYAAFGWVIAGMDVVDSITEEGMKYTSAAQNGAISNKANQPVITSITEISKREAMRYAK